MLNYKYKKIELNWSPYVNQPINTRNNKLADTELRTEKFRSKRIGESFQKLFKRIKWSIAKYQELSYFRRSIHNSGNAFISPQI